MPLRNRVTPFGELVAAPERGSLMGNRGLLHDAHRDIVRQWHGRRWICCLPRFKGRRREVMSPGLYTELFFLDEATALAAGHRPCAECRRADFDRFRAAWARARGGALPRATAIDERLHAERLAGGAQARHAAVLGALPGGAMLMLEDHPGVAWLLAEGRLRRWSPGGYLESVVRSPESRVTVLTPRCTVRTLAAGYVPAA